jgi:transcriptional regulator GlxA family with amidase domain
VKRPGPGTLSRIEQEVIAEVSALRAAPRNELRDGLLANPARLMRHLLLAWHGNVQMRLAPIAHEIGVEVRTLERLFLREYGRTMTAFQQQCRLKYACWMLTIFPPTKVGAIALFLGYEQLQDFNRFFRRHMADSPSAWGRKERQKIASASAGSGSGPSEKP